VLLVRLRQVRAVPTGCLVITGVGIALDGHVTLCVEQVGSVGVGYVHSFNAQQGAVDS
jgi:hypothetical protein